jgi:uncharacterized protein
MPSPEPVRLFFSPPATIRRTGPSARSYAGKSLAFVLKVVSRCNLNCSYCYVYNKGDETWRERPVVMPDHVVDAALDRIEEWCVHSGQRQVRITFHGGEPLLAGRARIDRWARRCRERLAGIAQVVFNVQTNATLIDDAWADLFAEHDIEVGVSIDGPAEIHDATRVDRKGRGSHERVVQGIARLHRRGVWAGALAVIQFGANSVAIHRYITSLGFRNVNYLLPDFTHDTVADVHRVHGPTPCADYLVPLFDEWWFNNTIQTRIPLFIAITRLLLGGKSNIDMVGNEPFGFVFIEPDGSIEDLDALRVCRHGMAGTKLSVFSHEMADVGALSELHRAAIFEGIPVPTGCAGCPEATTCSGGYLPHRWSSSNGFDNPSVWCADLLALFRHIRKRLEVDVEETALRRQALSEMGPVSR